MGLLYYIYYKASRKFRRKSVLLFSALQILLFYFLPISIINSLFPELGWDIEAIIPLTIIVAILLLIFDYIYYFRPSKTKAIIKKYAGRHQLIEENTDLAFALFFMAPYVVSLFIIVVLNAKTLPWQ